MALSSLTNLAISTVATAPSPATSGTTLTVASGNGSRFPSSGSFPIVIWPTSVNPDPSNAEIALCTARSTDTLTITRAQEGTSARTVVVGDQVMMAVTKAVLDGMAVDVQVFTSSGTWTKPAGAKYVHVRVIGGGGGGGSGRRGAAATARGGGSGAAGASWGELLIPASTCDSSCTVTVGAAGTGGAAVTTNDTNGNAGSPGTDSQFTYNSANSISISSAQGGAANGSGGSTSVVSGGSNFNTGMYPGSNGGAGNATGSGSGAPFNTPCSIGGGSGGGGVDSSNTAYGASAAGAPYAFYGSNLSPGSNTAAGASGTSGTALSGFPGTGGYGGGGGSGAAGGNGGNGANGGGGGGGGASLNGFNSGKGGNGGSGVVVVSTYF